VTLVRGGAKGGTQAGWRSEPCRHAIEIGHIPGTPCGYTFTCQRPQKFQGDRYPGHSVHIWQGDVGGVPAELTWRTQS
jgi:hypothetical protein